MNDLGKLQLKIRADDDGSADLIVTVAGHGFAGTGSAWLHMEELREFAAQIARYPLDNPVYLAGGYWGHSKPSRLEKIKVSIHVYLISGRGQIGIRVVACQPSHTRDDPAADHLVELEFQTTYNRLERFSRDLNEVLDGQTPFALIEEEIL